MRSQRRRRSILAGGGVLAVAALVTALVLLAGRAPQAPTPRELVADRETTLTAEATSTVPVEVPVLTGITLAEAELVCQAAGLAVKRVPTPPGDAAEGTVLEQQPPAGERVSGGSTVTLTYADSAAVAAAVANAGASNAPAGGIVVCIDPGHQQHANSGLEPIGPGATETKPKVTGGATGVVTRQPEHAFALALSLKVAERLEKYGVTVVLTRTTAAVDISNSQRAAVANQAGADLFVRIHADSNTNADVRGISTLYPGGNSWVTGFEAESLKAARIVQQEMVVSTGASDRGVLKRADLAGFNYATMPSILVETGFLSNPVDDKDLADPAYQDKLADGIARGVLSYLGVGG